ncbi:Alpha-ketoglutarate-dependent dioxygenase alkB 7, mitochondrial [Geranomyces variabilis]|uniref:Alpha-ketoglutarate-dependent dioxygenase alkB 7, mitochondrial n=1 Tax=Geranomyces variabilis TaxID=109894 RepID=A0AAD5TGD4_9FUNG|nr:Alpha-ketoglutarate-dependent dioxygenase alkB 7, mitochondrial [Geranomyces variabilis]
MLQTTVLGLSRFRPSCQPFLKLTFLSADCRLHSFSLSPANPNLDLTHHAHVPLPPPTALRIYPSFLAPDAQTHLAAAADSKLRRLAGKKYWDGHFDGVIRQYRECSVSAWAAHSELRLQQDQQQQQQQQQQPAHLHDTADAFPRSIVAKVKRTVEAERGEPIEWLDPHMLDLAADGEIKAHVDNIQASGAIITGLCLLSPTVIVFRNVADPTAYFSALMQPGALYVQRDALRFDYTHEIPGGDSALRVFGGKPIPPARRISIMMRDALSR